MLKKLIILRCDYGRIKGLSYGHYSRLKILEKILRPKFNIIYLIKKNKFNLHKKNEFYFNNHRDLQNFLIKKKPSYMFIDLPYEDYNYKKIVSKFDTKIAVIDNHLKNFHCSDFYINSSFLSSRELNLIKRKQEKYKFINFLNTKYFITNLKFSKRKFKSIKNILITIGGSDPGNYFKSIIKSLSKYETKNLTFNFILGWGHRNYNLPKNKNFKFFTKPSDIKLNKLRKKCDFAISTPGLMMIENAFFELPQVVIGKSLFEVNIAKKLLQKKIILRSDINKLHITLKKIINNKTVFETLNTKAKKFTQEIVPNKFPQILNIILNL